MSNDTKNSKQTLFGVLILILTAMIWGFAFVAQKYSTGHIDAVSVSGLRYVIATVVLGLTVLVTDLICKSRKKTVTKFTKNTIVGGVICGVVLFLATMMQQVGIENTTSGKAGFITTLYIVIVPVINLFSRKRTSLPHCYAIYIALVGFVLMCLKDTTSISQGDAVVLYSAVAFGFHIVFIERYCRNEDPQKLTFVQFATCAVLGIPAMAINGFPTTDVIAQSIWPILYIGIMSSGLAYTLQVVGQKRVESSIATLIMSLESVVALLGGMAILKEQITPKELAGCCLVLIAVFVARMKAGDRFLKLYKSRFFVDSRTITLKKGK